LPLGKYKPVSRIFEFAFGEVDIFTVNQCHPGAILQIKSSFRANQLAVLEVFGKQMTSTTQRGRNCSCLLRTYHVTGVLLDVLM
jgi:hypothetical protein